MKEMTKMPFSILMVTVIMQRAYIGNSENYSQIYHTAPALYVFGDSIFDNGNNNLLPTVARADFLPYGMSFSKGPTGRFTNGRTLVDFIAEFLGLPYSPPYLSVKWLMADPGELTGLNFASGSCGILPNTGSDLGKCLNFEEQVGLFEIIVKQELTRHYENSEELSNHLEKSIFVVSIGSNDYLNNYLDKQYDRGTNNNKRYSPQSFATLVIDRLSQQFERLYHLGARKLIMFEIGPIGCIPAITRQFKHNGKCVEEINQLAVIFNDHLAIMLQNLTSALQGSYFVLGHAHWLGYDAAISPSEYGLSDSTTPCCVTWFNGTSGCIPALGALACRNPDEHYFFDGYHLTETLYRTIATHCFNGSSVCIPQNIKQLVLQA